jgi:hypothetical protein
MNQKKDDTYLRCCNAIKPGDQIKIHLEDNNGPIIFDVVGKEKETNWILFGSMKIEDIPTGRSYEDFTASLGATRFDQIDLLVPGYANYRVYGWYYFKIGLQRNSADSMILQIIKKLT